MLLPQKTMCIKPRIFDEGFYDGSSKMGSLRRSGYKQSFHLLDLIPGDQSAILMASLLLLILLQVKGGTVRRSTLWNSWKVITAGVLPLRNGGRKTLVPQSPTGPHSVSL